MTIGVFSLTLASAWPGVAFTVQSNELSLLLQGYCAVSGVFLLGSLGRVARVSEQLSEHMPEQITEQATERGAEKAS